MGEPRKQRPEEPDPLGWTPEDYRQRPRDFDPALAELIVERIANGDTLAAVCRRDRDLPLPSTFLRWTEQEPDLELKYEAALRHNVDINFQRIPEVACSGRLDSGVQLAGLKHYTERARPEKYGPRAIVKTVPQDPEKDETPGGYDFTAEFIRRIDQMAERIAAGRAAAGDATGEA